MTAPAERIAVTCACGRRLRAKPSLAGKRVKCPACSAVVCIPYEERPIELEAVVPDPFATADSDIARSPWDLGDLLDEANHAAADEELSCPLCGEPKQAVARFCRVCEGEQETGIRHPSINEPAMIDTGDGVLIGKSILVRDDELCWNGGSVRRDEIVGIDWAIEPLGKNSTQWLTIQVIQRNRRKHRVRIASYESSSLLSDSLVSATAKQVSNEAFTEAQKDIGPICAKLTVWLNSGMTTLRRTSNIKDRPGYAHGIRPEAGSAARNRFSWLQYLDFASDGSTSGSDDIPRDTIVSTITTSLGAAVVVLVIAGSYFLQTGMNGPAFLAFYVVAFLCLWAASESVWYLVRIPGIQLLAFAAIVGIATVRLFFGFNAGMGKFGFLLGLMILFGLVLAGRALWTLGLRLDSGKLVLPHLGTCFGRRPATTSLTLIPCIASVTPLLIVVLPLLMFIAFIVALSFVFRATGVSGGGDGGGDGAGDGGDGGCGGGGCGGCGGGD